MDTRQPITMQVKGVDVAYTAQPLEGGESLHYVCVPPGHPDVERELDLIGYKQDPDVLDTWFSSGLWPLSTLNWPADTPELQTWNPSNVLATAREIITLWVSRMVMFNLYFRDCLPFTDVFIHAMIQDGEGQKMSKTLGNGVDPLDIIESHGADAMRFTLAAMTTHTQDLRMPALGRDLYAEEGHAAQRIRRGGANPGEPKDAGQEDGVELWHDLRPGQTDAGHAAREEHEQQVRRGPQVRQQDLAGGAQLRDRQRGEDAARGRGRAEVVDRGPVDRLAFQPHRRGGG
jgi:hypothetical protein